MTNRVHKYFGKDSPDIPDFVPQEDDNSAVDQNRLTEMAEAVQKTQDEVRKMVGETIGPYVEKAAQEYGPISVLACCMGMGNALAGCLSAVAQSGELDEKFCEKIFHTINSVTVDCCNSITTNVLKTKFGVPDDVMDELIRAAEADPDNPLDAISVGDIKEAMDKTKGIETPSGVSKEALLRIIREIVEGLADEKEKGDDDGKDS